MALKICTNWGTDEHIEATCPYCDTGDSYAGDYMEDDVVICHSCKKEFRLGPEG